MVLANVTACGRSRLEAFDAVERGGHAGAGGTPQGGSGATSAGGGAGIASGGAPFGGRAGAGTSSGGAGQAGETRCTEIAPGADRTTPWDFQFGDGEAQQGTSILGAPDGSVFVAGSFEGTIDLGGEVFESGENASAFIARFDPTGRHLYSRQFRGIGSEVRAMTLLPDGETLVTVGAFSGTTDFGGRELAGPGGAFLAAHDACGNVLSLKTLGDEASSTYIDSVARLDDGIVVAGTFSGVLDLGAGRWTNDTTNPRGFVARLDRSFEPVWARLMSGSRRLVVAADDNDDVYVAGQLVGGSDVDPVSAGRLRAFVRKLDARGAPLWIVSDRAEDEGSASDFESITLDAAGNVLALGSFIYETVDFADGVTSEWICCGDDAFVLSIQPDGTPLRVIPIDHYVATQVTPSGAGFIAVTGDASASGFDVRWFDGSGMSTSSHRFGSGSYVDVGGVAASGPNSLLVTGRFRGALDLGTGPFEPTEGLDWDGFVARLAPDALGTR